MQRKVQTWFSKGIQECHTKQLKEMNLYPFVNKGFNPVCLLCALRYALFQVYGDLGEIDVDTNGRSVFRKTDDIVKVWDIIGRSLVVCSRSPGSLPKDDDKCTRLVFKTAFSFFDWDCCVLLGPQRVTVNGWTGEVLKTLLVCCHIEVHKPGDFDVTALLLRQIFVECSVSVMRDVPVFM